MIIIHDNLKSIEYTWSNAYILYGRGVYVFQNWNFHPNKNNMKISVLSLTVSVCKLKLLKLCECDLITVQDQDVCKHHITVYKKVMVK